MNIPNFVETIVVAKREYDKKVADAHEEFLGLIASAVYDLTGKDIDSFLETDDKPERARAEKH